MARALRISIISVASMLGLVVLLGTIFLIGANTGTGRRAIAELAHGLSGGTLTIEGLTGRFPDRLRISELEIADTKGTFAILKDVSIDWSPSRLLFGEVVIDEFGVARAQLARLPVSKATSTPSFPRILVHHLAVARLELAAPVAGIPAILEVDGRLELASPTRGSVTLRAQRLDAPGHYDLDVELARTSLQAGLAITEPGHGLIAGLTGLPDLGPLAVKAELAGPRTAARIEMAVAAGPSRATAKGAINFETQSLALELSGTTPAMVPRPGLAWHAAQFDAHVAGPMRSPDISAHLLIDRIAAAGGGARNVSVTIAGTGGILRLNGTVSGLLVPGRDPELFAAAPVTVMAEARLRDPARPVVFSLTHPLITAQGEADTAGALKGKIALRLASLAPVVALTGVDVKGHAALDATIAAQGSGFRVGAEGNVSITDGQPQAVRLLGPNATFSLRGLVAGNAIEIDRATLDGRSLRASAQGRRKDNALDFAYRLAFTDLSALAPTLTGAIEVTGKGNGPENAFALSARARGMLGAANLAKGPIDVSLHARGLPDTPSARLVANGLVAGAPLQLQAEAERSHDGALQLTIQHAKWKSAAAEGRIVLPRTTGTPTGRVDIRVAELRDFEPFLGTALGGRFVATLAGQATAGKPELRLHAVAEQATFGDSAIARTTLDGTVANPLTRPLLALQLRLDGIKTGGIAGAAELAASGPLGALALRLTAEGTAPRGPATLGAEATLRLSQRRIDIRTLRLAYGGATARLLTPTTVDYRSGLTLGTLNLALDKARVTAGGRLSPTLDFRLSARDLDPALARLFVPKLQAEGRFAIDAKFTGTLAMPEGTVDIAGERLRFRAGPSGALPPATFDAKARISGASAAVEATLTAGPAVRLQVKGTLPLRRDGRIDLQSGGKIDLALFNSLLAANGRTIQGHVALTSRITGTLSAPVASGSAEISGATFRDYVQGVRITDIKGLIKAEGDTLRIVNLTGNAAPGTVGIGGTLKLAPELPLDLTLTFKNAAPLTTDILTARMNADLKISGAAFERLDVSGRVHVIRAEINIPDSYPKSVAVLEVRGPGESGAKPRAPWVVGLDLAVDAPGNIFVRGHGLTAEMGGRIAVGGTSEGPEITGAFTLRHGQFSIASQTLTLTSGDITFMGRSLSGRLDPALDFEAQSTANNVTATLKLTGYADAPKITLSSSPSLPQGELLSQLFFGQDTAHLSPFQAAQVAQALASLTGVSGGLDPLAVVRKGLGLDRLTVGSGKSSTSVPSFEAGKYITQNIYVGAKEGKLGGAQAEVQIDITKNLKLSTTVAAGGGTPATGATPENDPGSTIGLTYQFEY